VAFSDIALQPMSQTGKPDQDVPFEIVPESQQDFQYYKNRPDFRDEAGNTVSDTRSQTPASFLSKDDFSSPPSSRPGSPAFHSPRQHQQHRGGVHRKPVDPSHVPEQFRSGIPASSTNEGGDLGLRHGPYTDPYDDRTNLLHGVGDVRTPTGEFMSVDRWRAPADESRDGSGRNTPAEELNSGYDYFRNSNYEYFRNSGYDSSGKQ